MALPPTYNHDFWDMFDDAEQIGYLIVNNDSTLSLFTMAEEIFDTLDCHESVITGLTKFADGRTIYLRNRENPPIWYRFCINTLQIISQEEVPSRLKAYLLVSA